jgi:hypothetical protein
MTTKLSEKCSGPSTHSTHEAEDEEEEQVAEQVVPTCSGKRRRDHRHDVVLVGTVRELVGQRVRHQRLEIRVGASDRVLLVLEVRALVAIEIQIAHGAGEFGDVGTRSAGLADRHEHVLAAAATLSSMLSSIAYRFVSRSCVQ